MSAAPAFTHRPERLFTLRELTAAGYGSRDTLHRRISTGVIPAVKVGNTYKVKESDLRLLAEPIGAAPADPDTFDDLATVAAQVVSTWPRLSDERKRELGRLLSPA
jgi:excisionase family DNA binding protein